MQLFNMLQIMMVLLLQGEATYADLFGCLGKVENFPVSLCVQTMPATTGNFPLVNFIDAPWDNSAGAYDCLKGKTDDHKLASCCSSPDVRSKHLDSGLPCYDFSKH
ncbi:hypothetical protein MJO29_013121 [Puccinia striiformis f. sp. tritici]|nr:hypothetical protein MJO29_013121 [Puccinia striiformis f. sp. tritici]